MKLRDCSPEPLTGPVDGEVPQGDDIEAHLGPIDLGELLAGELRGAVRRVWSQGSGLGSGVFRRAAVHGRARREDNTNACSCRSCEHALRGDQVVACVQTEVCEAAGAWSACEVEDTIESREIDLLDREIGAVDREVCGVLRLELGRVVVRKAVNGREFVP